MARMEMRSNEQERITTQGVPSPPILAAMLYRVSSNRVYLIWYKESVNLLILNISRKRLQLKRTEKTEISDKKKHRASNRS